MGLRLFRPTGLNTAPQHGYRMAIRRAFFRPISPYGAQYGLLAPPISPYGAQYGSAAPPRGARLSRGFAPLTPGCILAPLQGAGGSRRLFFGFVAPPRGRVCPGVAQRLPRATQIPQQRRSSLLLAITPTIRYHGHLYCRAATPPSTMTEEANHGQISQSR